VQLICFVEHYELLFIIFAKIHNKTMSDLKLFGSDFSSENFENNCKENGFTYWSAFDLMTQLGYENWASFQKAINKAMTTCNTLGIPIMENFVQIQILPQDGKPNFDFKLSRFACYLVVMNADTKKTPVAQAQAYFATLAGAVQNYLDESGKVERLNVRNEVSERESSLSGVAHKAGVTNYAFFQNAGYRGMYNKNISQLKVKRNVPNGRTLLDFMGKEELAANLFRITQTELKIKQENISGQGRLENAAENVGRKVRNTMIDISGVAPENFIPVDDIKQVKKELKTTSKQIRLIDKKKK
jgi:DNA-damage-inducible protein D